MTGSTRRLPWLLKDFEVGGKMKFKSLVTAVTLVTLLLVLALPGVAQLQQTVQIPLASPPIAPSPQGPPYLVGLQGGPSTYYFWGVSEFPIGNSPPSYLGAAVGAQATLSGSNYIVVTWNAVPGASSYDILETTTPIPPSGACNCAAAIGQSTLILNVQTNSLSAYTVNTFNPANNLITFDNEATGAAGISSLAMRQGSAGVGASPFALPDSFFPVSPADCSFYLTAGAWAASPAGAGGLTAPAMVRTGGNNWVLQGTTTAAANSIALTCDIQLATRSTSLRGAKITAIQLFYGVQGNALTSITGATFASLTYPVTGASAGVTNNTSAGGTLSVTPSVLQLATTTSGQCYSENIALGTPLQVNTINQRLNIEQIFNQTGALATTLQFCGAIVYYSNSPF
jgi:hypothetical protein